MRKTWKIVVMGLGYIGLPTASMLATKGNNVLGVDINKAAVDTINSGNIHIVEPDLDIMVRSAVNSGNLRASLDPDESDVFILAVPTPFKKSDGNRHVPDISFVESATEAIIPFLREGNLVILESTSPVGTTERVNNIIVSKRPELKSKIFIAHCPERVLPGHIIRELVDNDRIIGGIDKASADKANELYKSFCNGNIYLTDSRTAELAKLVENSFRDVNIAFANELSIICDHLNIKVWDLIELANRHPRVNILQPGPGVGGHCIAVDPWFIVDAAPEQARLIRAAREINDSKPHYVFARVRQKADRFKNPVIACLGLSFKADIDDLRESPSMEIVDKLAKAKVGKLLVIEPNIDALPESLSKMPDVRLMPIAEALKQADIVVLLVNHKEFYEVDSDLLKEKVVIDTRGVWR